jgi:tocopherol cyclase
MLIKTRYPDLFHGHRKKRNFFEGWYFKIVDPTEQHVFAFIPGLFLGKGTDKSHSFIQFVHGSDAYFRYLSFPVDSFHAQKNTFAIEVNSNSFSLRNMSLNIEDPSLKVRGSLSFQNVQTWPDTMLNPGSMGFYNYIPRMQCYSQVCALDMELEGSLLINGDEIDFRGGRGYVEKNWGTAFPYSWIWIQSNNFSSTGTSLTCSLGHIPFLFSSFRGFLIGLTVEGHFYSFTTMNRSRCHIQRIGRDVHIEVLNSDHILTMKTVTDPDKFVELHGPRDGRMVPLVQENLLGRVSVELRERSGKVLFTDEGRCAGIEYGGRQMLILDQEDKLEENVVL